jgi:hypothetical protein
MYGVWRLCDMDTYTKCYMYDILGVCDFLVGVKAGQVAVWQISCSGREGMLAICHMMT